MELLALALVLLAAAFVRRTTRRARFWRAAMEFCLAQWEIAVSQEAGQEDSRQPLVIES